MPEEKGRDPKDLNQFVANRKQVGPPPAKGKGDGDEDEGASVTCPECGHKFKA